MTKITRLLLVFVFAFSAVAFAAEQKVTFKWTYPEDQNSIINGFRIYDNRNEQRPRVLATINNATVRKFVLDIELMEGENKFFISPFIGNTEGKPSNVTIVKKAVFYEITDFDAECTNCK